MFYYIGPGDYLKNDIFLEGVHLFMFSIEVIVNILYYHPTHINSYWFDQIPNVEVHTDIHILG